MNKAFIYICIVSFWATSCKVNQVQDVSVIEPSGKIVSQEDTTTAEEQQFEAVIYREEPARLFRLIHTKLEVKPDWNTLQLHGIANIILQPYFYEQSALTLDAKSFDIHSVVMKSGDKETELQYKYDRKKLVIDLGGTYGRNQKIQIKIDYTANPEADFDSIVTTNDKKGLYFINPTGEIPNKPRQIWTHGETSTASRWFPTIDHPNQKSTQEIFITVDENFETLSNGKLVYSATNQDGTKTDYWKMDQPHAPYLFMMAVGDFTIYEDSWNEIRVDYYVEPAYGKYVSNIFGNTPEMIGYFSKLFNFPYPWDKYSQVVVRDFVSGAMENTTASVFMEDLNVNSRELLDYNWDDIIAHELVHQWFGNLVTCESWANLPLNESFATYGEYLWKNHKYGREEAEYHLHEELQNYLGEASGKQVDLIRFDYVDEDDMFDSHSYAKGGLILHMLRNYVGDEAFFSSLEHYLKSHAFGKAEVHDLRLAFEHVVGEDLNWFFNQWFLDAGHPVLEVEEDYDESTKLLTIKVAQKQDTDLYPVFKLPLVIDIWQNGVKTEYISEIDKPYQEFQFENQVRPDLVLFDSEQMVVGEIMHSKSISQLKYQFDMYKDNFRARYLAFSELKELLNDPTAHEVISEALNDSFWVIREQAIETIEQDSTTLFSKNEDRIVEIARSDENNFVRAAAISVLITNELLSYTDLFRTCLYDSSYSIAGSALYGYLQTDQDDIGAILESLRSENNFNITSSIADFYIRNQEEGQYDWFLDKLQRYNGSELWYFVKFFGVYLVEQPDEIIKKGIHELERIASTHEQYYNRLSAYQTLQLFVDFDGVLQSLEKIKQSEKDPRVLSFIE